ncbi:type II toxin-antitoxin system RelE/ParE family toxin [Nocardioides sp. WS12]|uniref:type II toxin-antitoxin system RelE/ParE family toxin n=1 Tax=Nocardioides sp. WS12 TaxID=2486272 RepID=UPI00191EEC9B|nr:type II toxin-antitoxin system RelE/ParE family toxin [Nocardioides sp. WS12]
MQYEDRKLEKVCTVEREMQRKRADIAAKLKLRIKALENADTVGDLKDDDPLGYWHELTADRPGHWAGKLSGNYRLVIRPEGDGETWEAVTVTVIEITDYHGN